MQSIIVEEAESPSSPSRPVSVELRAYLQPLSPIQEPPSPQTVPHGPLDDSPSVRIELPEVDHLSAARIIDLEPHDEFDFTAETNPELTSRYFSFTYEAETELKRSPALWPDTDYSREVLARASSPPPSSPSPSRSKPRGSSLTQSTPFRRLAHPAHLPRHPRVHLLLADSLPLAAAPRPTQLLGPARLRRPADAALAGPHSAADRRLAA